MYLGQQPHIMKASGVPEDLIIEVQKALDGWPAKPGGLERAIQIVPDEIVQMLTASGTPENEKKKVKEYLDKGATCPVLYPLSDDVFYFIRKMAEGWLLYFLVVQGCDLNLNSNYQIFLFKFTFISRTSAILRY